MAEWAAWGDWEAPAVVQERQRLRSQLAEGIWPLLPGEVLQGQRRQVGVDEFRGFAVCAQAVYYLCDSQWAGRGGTAPLFYGCEHHRFLQHT